MITVQYLDNSGNWRDSEYIMNSNSYIINTAMKQAKMNNSNTRVRAIDDNGNLVDMLN